MRCWCISEPSARYVAKMGDGLEVYQRPYDPKRPGVCLEEGSKVLHSTPQGTMPMQPGASARQDCEYKRHGTAPLFLSIEPLRGPRQVRVTQQRTAQDFAQILRTLVDEDYPQAETIVLVVDNLNTHQPGALYEQFSPAEARRIAAKLEWRYTPEHGSWLNIAECELSVLTRQCPSRRIPDAETLRTEVDPWTHRRNQAQVPVDWQFTTDDARIKRKRLYPVLKSKIQLNETLA